MEFFRHCPGCGRRFHINLVRKSMVHLDREPIPTHTVTNIMASSSMTSASPAVFVVQEGKPMVIDVEEFQYAYRCKHCGHEWSEKHIEEHKER